MADFSRSVPVAVPADELFAFLADVRNAASYVRGVHEAEPAGEGRVRVRGAFVAGPGRDVPVDVEVAVEVDAPGRRISWAVVGAASGSSGAGAHAAGGQGATHGHLLVEPGSDDTCSVTLTLHTDASDAPELDEQLTGTAVNIRRIVEGHPPAL